MKAPADTYDAFWVAEYRHNIVGMVAAALLPGGESVELHRLQVASSYRRKGLGRRLVSEVERFAVESHRGKVELSTITLHAEAMQLYNKCGFERMRSEVHGDIEIVFYEKNF